MGLYKYLNRDDVILRNKARLVVQCYNQENRIDFQETFTSVPGLKAIRMLVTSTSHMNSKLSQMDVKKMPF